MGTSTNCLIRNLAICDLLIAVIQTLLFVKHLHNGVTWLGGTVGIVICKVTTYGASMLLSCSALNFIAIAADQYLAITRPLTYKLSSRWVVRLGIPVIWLISALSCIDMLFAANIYDDRTPQCLRLNVALTII